MDSENLEAGLCQRMVGLRVLAADFAAHVTVGGSARLTCSSFVLRAKVVDRRGHSRGRPLFNSFAQLSWSSNLGASVQMYGGSHTLVYIGGAEGLESFQGV